MTCRFTSLMTRISLVILGLCIPILGFALSKPTFNIVPTTPTQVTVPSTGSLKVNYQVTNNTKLTRTLTMVPIKGISQNISGVKNCKSPFTLAPMATGIYSDNTAKYHWHRTFAFDLWLKDITPSASLRQWFHRNSNEGVMPIFP